jgi:5-methylcytosine-specific restriction endonuclease McrA
MLEKPKRVKDRKAIEAARKPHCEFCGIWGKGQVHHIKSRGSGGHDTPDNLIHLCVECHTRVHAGRISKAELLAKK